MKPASERAYEALKSRILNGSLASGDRLVERELCAELDVSRTPVREALGQLCAEGLAITRPRRGVVVSDIDTSEVSEIFELGVVLEGFAARLCAKKANGETIKKLKAIIDEMTPLMAEETLDFKRYLELDHEFHEAIAQGSENSRLQAMIRQNVSMRVLTQAYTNYKPFDFEQSFKQHQTIYQAIELGDADWALTAMQNHILTGKAASEI